MRIYNKISPALGPFGLKKKDYPSERAWPNARLSKADRMLGYNAAKPGKAWVNALATRRYVITKKPAGGFHFGNRPLVVLY